jgi:hypothetical protein
MHLLQQLYEKAKSFMKDLRDLAFGWLRKAESDLTTAQVMLRDGLGYRLIWH